MQSWWQIHHCKVRSSWKWESMRLLGVRCWNLARMRRTLEATQPPGTMSILSAGVKVYTRRCWWVRMEYEYLSRLKMITEGSKVKLYPSPFYILSQPMWEYVDVQLLDAWTVDTGCATWSVISRTIRLFSRTSADTSHWAQNHSQIMLCEVDQEILYFMFPILQMLRSDTSSARNRYNTFPWKFNKPHDAPSSQENTSRE